MKRILLFFTTLFLLSKILVFSPGCANIVPPQGGPRDSIPPVLLKASPGDSTRNFTGNRIVFTFDEFVDIQNLQQNLIVSPSPQITPSVDFKLKEVTVRLKDSLESNTTYSLNFGNAIRDFTEGNPVKDFTYTFSTGPFIDSLELRGNVLLAESGKKDTTLMVLLHVNSNDSAIIKERPRYMTRLDGRGNFVFRNLPPKTFYLYVLKDENGTRRYAGGKQLFGFAQEPVTITDSVKPVTLYAYAAKQDAQADAVNRPKPPASTDKRLRLQTSLLNGQQDLLTRLTISFELPLRTFDPQKIRLYKDSSFTPVDSSQFIQDSTRTKLNLSLSWQENMAYHIILDKDFAEDSAGRKLFKTDTLSFRTRKLTDYGSLKLKIRNLEFEKNPVLFFVQNETVLKSFPLTGPEFSLPMLLPGEYELRILYDTNKNGVWDPGNFFGQKRQPELVKPIERKITVKPVWENEFEIAL